MNEQQPLSISYILNTTLNFTKTHYVKFIPYVAVFVIMNAINSYLSTTFIFGLLWVFIISAVINIITFVLELAWFKDIASLYRGGESKSMDDRVKEIMPIIIPIFLISLLVGLIVIGGFFLFIIPGFLFSLWFAFTMHAMVLGDAKGTAALSYSKSLVKGRWWKVFFLIAIPSFVFSIMWIIPFTILSTIATLMGASTTIQTMLSSTTLSLFMPFFVSMSMILYLELKKTRTTPQIQEVPLDPID